MTAFVLLNILDPGQAQQTTGPDLDPNYLTLVFMSDFSEKGYLKK